MTGTKSQELVLAQVHPLNDVSTVVEHSLYVFRVDRARKVRVAIMLSIPACRTYALQFFILFLYFCFFFTYQTYYCTDKARIFSRKFDLKIEVVFDLDLEIELDMELKVV